jgi:hypothetical protein
VQLVGFYYKNTSNDNLFVILSCFFYTNKVFLMACTYVLKLPSDLQFHWEKILITIRDVKKKWNQEIPWLWVIKWEMGLAGHVASMWTWNVCKKFELEKLYGSDNLEDIGADGIWDHMGPSGNRGRGYRQELSDQNNFQLRELPVKKRTRNV